MPHDYLGGYPETHLEILTRFTHVVARIPAGTLLGIAHWTGSEHVLDEIRAKGGTQPDTGFNVAVTDLLREHGYTVLDEAGSIGGTSPEIGSRPDNSTLCQAEV
jgi:hypothetical protein